LIEIAIFVFLLLFFVVEVVIVLRLWKMTPQTTEQNEEQTLSAIERAENALTKHFTEALEHTNTHLKRSFTAIISSRQGKLGEMEALFALKERYIRLIPLGQPIDFIGVGNDTIDFIEIKTGRARLTNAEKKIKDLIEKGKVRFREMREADYQ